MLLSLAIFGTMASVVAALPAVDRGHGVGKSVKVCLGDDALSKYVDRAFGSLSVELAYWDEFFGSFEEPNEFSLQLLQNIVDRTAQAPYIRIGGVSQDSSIYDPSASGVNRISSPENGAIWRTVYGPSFYDSLKTLPASTKFILPLNLENDTLSIALDAAKAGFSAVNHDRIWSFELGNEPGHYLNATEYVSRWKNWTGIINDELEVEKPLWWTGSDVRVQSLYWQAIEIDAVIGDLNTDGHVKEAAVHQYAWDSCTASHISAATAAHVVNHRNITATIDLLKPDMAAAHAAGADFVMGEFNSVACSGRPNVTDTFAQALWVLDVMLYGASTNITRMHLHHGATLASQSDTQLNVVGDNNSPGYSTYDLWYPRNSSLRGEQRTNPSYVGFLTLAEAIGSSGLSRVQPLSVESQADTVAAYGIWDDAVSSERLARAVFINFEQLNLTSTPSFVTIDVHALADRDAQGAIVKRMTAPGLDELDSALVTWAGQSWKTGVAVGEYATEGVKGGKVRVRGSEAVLVDFA